MSGALLLGLKEEFSEKAGIYGYQAVLTQNASDTYDKAELWNRLSDLSENASVPFIIIGSTLVIVFFFCNRKN